MYTDKVVTRFLLSTRIAIGTFPVSVFLPTVGCIEG